MERMRSTIGPAAAFAALALAAGVAAAPRPAAPKLVLFIVVDQLRGDVPGRYAHRFGAGGFRWLLANGVHYTNAHYRHATTWTAAGHATLVTGGNPPEHGIVGNDWLDRNGQWFYSVQDDGHTILGGLPAHTAARGKSPRLLTSSTIGDEMVLASNGRSLVFSVSIKDRGAVFPGGHLGKAFWYTSSSGRFVTSTYYYESVPEWVAAFNAAGHADAWRGRAWSLLADPASYERIDADDRPYEKSQGSLGRTFPHPILGEGPAYYRTLCFTPMSDELTGQFVATLLDNEPLGLDESPDLLAVSFSGTDYVGHAFGPYSLEAEDNLLRLDRTIARLLQAVDAKVGLKHTLVVLSSDHGIDAAPEHRRTLACGLEGLRSEPDGRLYVDPDDDTDPCSAAGRHFPRRLIATANETLRARLGIEADLVMGYWPPAVYLDRPQMETLGLDEAEVEAVLADALAAIPGMALALTRTDLLAGRHPATPLGERIARAFHPTRSGNVIIAQEPSWYLDRNALANSAMHGSPHPYDTHVPVIVVGAGIKPATIHRRIGPEDIAPTLAIVLDVQPPSGSIGDPLAEVLPARPLESPAPRSRTDPH